jgi:hypothetical protein
MGSSQSEQLAMFPDFISDLRHLRRERTDGLLTVLTGVLILLIFVIAPLLAFPPFIYLLLAYCWRSSAAW